MTDKEKFLINLTLRCLSNAAHFREIVKEKELSQFYPDDYEECPRDDFSPVSDDEYKAGTLKQRTEWCRQMDERSDAWHNKRNALIDKIYDEVKVLLKSLADA